jgi:hypothetical protein
MATTFRKTRPRTALLSGFSADVTAVLDAE